MKPTVRIKYVSMRDIEEKTLGILYPDSPPICYATAILEVCADEGLDTDVLVAMIDGIRDMYMERDGVEVRRMVDIFVTELRLELVS